MQILKPRRKRSPSGIAQGLDRRRDTAAELNVMFDGQFLLRLRILRRVSVARVQVEALLVLLMPALERVLCGVTQLANGRREALCRFVWKATDALGWGLGERMRWQVLES
jgi:hypothetical protein